MTKITEGYKETEIGIIPEDWEVYKVEDLSIRVCVGFVGTCSDSYTSETNGVPMIRTTNLKTSGVDLMDLKFVTHEFHSRNKKSQLRKGDILVARHGSNGKASVFDYEFEANSLNIVIIRPNEELINSYYFKEFFNCKLVTIQVANKIGGSVQSVINTKSIATIDIAFPPLPEQQRIAEILSSTDSHIEKLDKIIEDYQLLKKGMMKKLLTEGIGHTEFKETEIGRIPKAWDVIELNRLGDTFNGLSGVTKDDFGSGVPFIPYMNIFTNTKIDVNRMDYVNLDNKKKQNSVKFGDIFFTTSSETAEEAGMSSVLLNDVGEMYLNSFCFGYRLFNFDSLRPEFARFLMRVDYVRKEIQKLAQGSTRFNLSKGNVLKIKVGLPSIDEQLEIASQLSNLESRIELLVQDKNDFIELKKSLMEKLLTGKIRVDLRSV